MSRIIVMAVLAAVVTAMLALSASPAMAFIHGTVPAGGCAANPEAAPFEAADNETAEDAIVERNPVKGPVVEQTHLIVDAPAPDDCPAHK